MHETPQELQNLQRLLDESHAAAGEHMRGIFSEELAVIVHGVAHLVDTAAPENAAFREHLLAIYGPGWVDWGAGSQYAWIEPHKMFAVRMHS